MRSRWQRFLKRPVVAHVRRAQVRYRDRMGSESGAAMAFFSLLAVIPTLVFAAAGLGLVLTVWRPDWLETVRTWLGGIMGSLDASSEVLETVTGTIWDWDQGDRKATNSIVRLLGGAFVLVAWSGGNWLRHLRRALNMIWRPDADMVEARAFFLWRWTRNFGEFLVFAALILLGMATSTGAQAKSFFTWLLNLLHVSADVGPVSLLRVAAAITSLLIGWCLFAFLLRVVPSYNQPFRSIARGALLGAVAWFCIQQVSSLLVRLFAGGRTASVFGPVFVILLLFNVFGQVVLFVASWTATAVDNPLEKRIRIGARSAPTPQETEPTGPGSPA